MSPGQRRGIIANGVTMASNLLYAGGYQPAGHAATPFPTLNTWTDSVWVNLPASAISNAVWTPLLCTGWGVGNGLLVFDVSVACNWDHLDDHRAFATGSEMPAATHASTIGVPASDRGYVDSRHVGT